VPKIHVIHENDAWVEPLRAAFDERALPYEEWFLSEGTLDLAKAPPQGVFYNRMSASSHTRGHRYAPELTAATLAWLESHGRRVINNGRALQLEISKVAQYEALRAHGIRTPRTVAAVGARAIVAAARTLPSPFITKHNRAGKGLGVRLFQSVDALQSYVTGPAFEESVDGITSCRNTSARRNPSSRASSSSADSSSMPSRSTPRSASSSARPTCARSTIASARSERRLCRRRLAFASWKASRIR